MHVRYYLGRNDGSLTFHAPRSVAMRASELAAGLAEAAESKGSVCTFGLKAGYSPASGPFVEFVHGDRLLDAIADGSVSDETCWQDPLTPPPPCGDARLMAMRLAARPDAAATAAELLSAVASASGGDPAADRAAALLEECRRAAASGDVAALEGMVPALEAAVIREARPPTARRRRAGGRRKPPP